MARIAATTNAIGVPLNALGTGAISIFSLNIEKMVMTSKNPKGMKSEKTIISAKL